MNTVVSISKRRRSQQGHTNIVKLLVEVKDIDLKKGPNGKTPLQKARQKKYSEIIKLLLGFNEKNPWSLEKEAQLNEEERRQRDEKISQHIIPKL